MDGRDEEEVSLKCREGSPCPLLRSRVFENQDADLGGLSECLGAVRRNREGKERVQRSARKDGNISLPEDLKTSPMKHQTDISYSGARVPELKACARNTPDPT